jgi:predicted hydrocarbon binding protein
MIWGRQTDMPVCHSLGGLFQATLHAASAGYEYHVVETTCHAVGQDQCIFQVNKKPIGQL